MFGLAPPGDQLLFLQVKESLSVGESGAPLHVRAQPSQETSGSTSGTSPPNHSRGGTHSASSDINADGIDVSSGHDSECFTWNNTEANAATKADPRST